jgi:hypothetical protein|tara:strand:+ start:22 stop:705 length:684 start_codon:yes stop_codon:yes gene_type:complete
MSVIETHTINKDNESRFVEFLIQQRDRSTDRNKDWFDALLHNHFYKVYSTWTFSTIDDEIWCMAALQNHNLPGGVMRAMSRLYIVPKFRANNIVDDKRRQDVGLKYRHNHNPQLVPSRYLFNKQWGWCLSIPKTSADPCNWIIMSMEHNNRRRIVKLVTNHFNANYGTDFKVLPRLYQTFPNDNDWRAWQVVTCMTPARETVGEPPMKSISVEEWKDRFGNPSLSDT